MSTRRKSPVVRKFWWRACFSKWHEREMVAIGRIKRATGERLEGVALVKDYPAAENWVQAVANLWGGKATLEPYTL